MNFDRITVTPHADAESTNYIGGVEAMYRSETY